MGTPEAQGNISPSVMARGPPDQNRTGNLLESDSTSPEWRVPNSEGTRFEQHYSFPASTVQVLKRDHRFLAGWEEQQRGTGVGQGAPPRAWGLAEPRLYRPLLF